MERWRCYLFGVPYSEQARAEEREKEKAGGQVQVFRQRISREKALEVLHEGGRLKRSEYMRCRVRYLNNGAVLGSKEFMESVFQSARDQFSSRRKEGSCPPKGLEVVPKPERIYSLRQLQKDVVT